MTALVVGPLKLFRGKTWKNLWRDYFATPQDPFDPIDVAGRARELADATLEQIQLAVDWLQARYQNRAVSVTGIQTISAFTFGGAAALFIGICAGMIAAPMKWLPLLLVPSVITSGASLYSFLQGIRSAKNELHPRYVQDELVEVLQQIKQLMAPPEVRLPAGMRRRLKRWLAAKAKAALKEKEAAKQTVVRQSPEEIAARSMQQRFKLWLARTWAERGIRFLQISIVLVVLEMIAFSVLRLYLP